MQEAEPPPSLESDLEMSECSDITKHSFTSMPIKKLVVRTSLPLIMSLVIEAIYGIVDSIFIGNALGNEGLAALSVFYPVEAGLCYGIGVLVSTGSEGPLAKALGEQNFRSFRTILTHILIFALLVAVALPVVFLPVLRPLLSVLGATPSIVDDAYYYAVVVVCTQIGYSMLMLVSVLFTLIEKPLLVFGANLAAALLNAGIDALLLFGLKTDLWGAAVATGASGILVGTAMFVYFVVWSKKQERLYRELAEREVAEDVADVADGVIEDAKLPDELDVPNYLPSLRLLRPLQFSIIKKVLALGVSTALVEAMFSLITTIANVHIKRLVPRAYPAARGYDAEAITTALIAAFGIGMRVQIFAFMPEVGVEQAALALMSFNLGRRDYNRVRRIFSFSNIYALCLCVALSGVLLLATRPLVVFFGFEAPAGFAELPLELDPNFVVYMAVSFTALTAPLYVSGVVYQAQQRSAKAFLVLTAHPLLIVIPLIIVLPLVFPSIMVLLLAYPAGTLLASLLGALITVRMFRRLRGLRGNGTEEVSESYSVPPAPPAREAKAPGLSKG
eukprot:gnl/Chilomastix_cuspidata/598.p1 GENE.gnl/Chilomastix_cuspidata/598~~gnl/Chilomastix_cuspidata/598.p1  ORF type:complete len:560 (+),score=208.08 gnl/Chilomastix_cuspidata/598:2475-4154(+)